MGKSLRALQSLVLVGMSWGCLNTATNDKEVLPPLADASARQPTDGGGARDGGAEDGTVMDGSSPNPNPKSMVTGTAISAKCSSYAPRTDKTCYGFYCGISQATLGAELNPSRKCNVPLDDVCAGTLSQRISKCTRSVKMDFRNAGDSDSEIRKKIEACAREDARVDQIASPECLSCYLDAAMCASEHCTAECLLNAQNSECDACRAKNMCNEPLPGCAGLPSPF